jgi:hypothetical protein
MKTAVLASLAFAFSFSTAATAQPRPDFSGNWRLDPNRSDSATYPELTRPVTLVITQTPTELRVETRTARGTSTDVAYFRNDQGAASAESAVARWRSDVLVIDAVRDIRGQSVTVQQALSMNADRNELTIESTVNVQHGYTLSGAKVYGAGKDVFVRVAP